MKPDANLFPDFKPREYPSWVKSGGLGRYHTVLSALVLMGGAIERAEADGIAQVSPFIALHREDVPELRRRYGRQTWRLIHHSSAYLNALRVRATFYGWPRDIAMADTSPTAMKFLLSLGHGVTPRTGPAKFLLRCAPKNHTLAQEHWVMYRDCERLGVRMNPDWSFARVRKEHDRAVVSKAVAGTDQTPWAPAWSTEVDGYTFTLLRSERELAQEGAEQRHCVGSYAREAKSGGSLIFKIEGRERATCEFSIFGGWHIAQIKAFANRSVSRTCRAAAEAVLTRYRDDVSGKAST